MIAPLRATTGRLRALAALAALVVALAIAAWQGGHFARIAGDHSAAATTATAHDAPAHHRGDAAAHVHASGAAHCCATLPQPAAAPGPGSRLLPAPARAVLRPRTLHPDPLTPPPRPT